MLQRRAKYSIGQVVQHKIFGFRGVVFDVDPTFSNTEEWWQSIPSEMRPKKDQPFYHLFAESEQGPYTAYVSEQNLILDEENEPVENPDIEEFFGELHDGVYSFDISQVH